MEVSKHMHLLYMLLSSTQRLLLHCLQKLALHSIKWGNILQMISNEEIRVRRQRWQRQCLAYKEKYNIFKERQKDCWNKSIRKNSEYRRLKMGNWGGKGMIQQRCNKTESRKQWDSFENCSCRTEQFTASKTCLKRDYKGAKITAEDAIQIATNKKKLHWSLHEPIQLSFHLPSLSCQ